MEPTNVKSENSLAYLVEIVKSRLFGKETYPTLFLKAAVYTHHIINDHVFWDGNKRTGMTTALYFLGLNNLRVNISDQDIVDLALKIESKSIDIDGIAHELESRTSAY